MKAIGTHWRQVRSFILRERGSHLAIALVAFFFVLSFVSALSWWGKLNITWGFMEPVIGATTLIVAIMLWLGEASQDWENSLPKRVTAVFLYPAALSRCSGHVAMVCEQAYLAGEDDLRSWSQQLGGQMTGDGALQFTPFIEEIPGDIASASDGTRFKPYWTIFELTAEPKPDKARLGAAEVDKIKDAIRTRHSIRWTRGTHGEPIKKEYGQLLRFKKEGEDGVPWLEPVSETSADAGRTTE